MKTFYFLSLLALFTFCSCDDTPSSDLDIDSEFEENEDDVQDSDAGPVDDTSELCGNGVCDGAEDCSLCPQDCGECESCGDGVCQADEDCQSCANDCSECSTTDNDEGDAYAEIASPTNGSVFQAGAQITIKTDTYSPQGIGIVRFWVNGNNQSEVVCEVPEAPFECSWKPNTGGDYELGLRAKDSTGKLIESETGVTVTVKGSTTHDSCPKGAATSDDRSHDCTYDPSGSPRGNLRMKYPGGKWISIGCKNGKPVADNSNTQWKMEGRQLHVVDSNLKLRCAELDHPCTCGSGAENFHGMSPDYQSANALGNAINYPGGGWIFNNNGHETCLGIHKQGRPGEIESIWSRPKGSHDHSWPGHSHKECPIFCLGKACP